MEEPVSEIEDKQKREDREERIKMGWPVGRGRIHYLLCYGHGRVLSCLCSFFVAETQTKQLSYYTKQGSIAVESVSLGGKGGEEVEHSWHEGETRSEYSMQRKAAGVHRCMSSPYRRPKALVGRQEHGSASKRHF